MKQLVLIFIFILNALFAHSQGEFQHEVSKRKLVLHDFTGTNLNFEIDLGESKHTSVSIYITYNDGSEQETIFIKDDLALQKATSNIKSIVIRHKKRFGLRFNQKLNDNEKAKRKINRVRVSSETAGGSSTTTTINSA